jgi:hypothetical protein
MLQLSDKRRHQGCIPDLHQWGLLLSLLHCLTRVSSQLTVPELQAVHLQ